MQSSKFRRNVLASTLAVVLFSPAVVNAQQADATDTSQEESATQDNAEKPRTLDNVVVTGSRIKRSEVEGPAPVTIITGEQMKKQGFTTVYEALGSLTEVTGGVQGGASWGQATVNAYPLNLRNLGPGRSLLLINGRRVADYPLPYQGKSNFANYNNIPSGVVDRIEVLSGSASAIYGSDAVAGVVNVILKEDAEGDTFRARYNMTERGGRSAREFSWSGGKSGDRWSVAYTMQYFDRQALYGRDRGFINSELDKPYESWGAAERHFGVGHLSPSPLLILQDLDNVVDGTSYRIAPPVGTCEQYDGAYFSWNQRSYNRNTGQEFDKGSYCAGDIGNYWTFQPGSEDFATYLYGTYDITDRLQVWASYGLWDSSGRSATFLNGYGSGPYWDANANGGAGGRRSFYKTFSPMEIGGPGMNDTRTNEVSWDFATGLRGKFGEKFDWDVSIGRAEYSVEEKFPTVYEDVAADYFLGPQMGTQPFDLNGDGVIGADESLPIYAPDYDRLWSPISRADHGLLVPIGRKEARSWITQAIFTFSGDLFEGWAGPIGFAGSVEYAQQGYKLTPDPNTLGPDPVYSTPFGNVESGGGERNRYAAGIEFKVPLLKTLTLSAATRYDRYDAVADAAANTWNAGLEWRPFENLLLRGSYATSFRAPDMHFVYAAPSVSIADETDILRCVQDPNRQPGAGCGGGEGSPYHIDNPEIARQGTPDLLYETGDSQTVGFVWDAFENFSVSADYYKIRIKNAIDDIGSGQVLADEAYCLTGQTPDGSIRTNPPSDALCELQLSRVTRAPDPDGAGPLVGNVTHIEIGPINRAEQIVEGVDVKMGYQIPETAWGSFRFDLGYTNQLSVKSRSFPDDPLPEQRDDNLRSKTTLGVNWQKDKWNATLFAYRSSGGKNGRYAGGCLPFEDGYTPPRFSGEPGEEPTRDCYDPLQITQDGVVIDNPSPTAGQSTRTHFDRASDPVFVNASVGYQVTDKAKVNLYVNNAFGKIYRTKYLGDWFYGYGDINGRSWGAEFVYNFD